MSPTKTKTARRKKAWYTVTANRTTTYEVKAFDSEDAKDRMINGEGKEVDGVTHDISAELGR